MPLPTPTHLLMPPAMPTRPLMLLLTPLRKAKIILLTMPGPWISPSMVAAFSGISGMFELWWNNTFV
jgi:hypothetical protein